MLSMKAKGSNAKEEFALGSLKDWGPRSRSWRTNWTKGGYYPGGQTLREVEGGPALHSGGLAPR